VEELAGVERLRDPVRDVEAAHVLVRHLRVDAHHIRLIQRLDEGEHVPGGRQVDVAARLVRLGLERKAQLVALNPSRRRRDS
jgi:hypothetical protein